MALMLILIGCCVCILQVRSDLVIIQQHCIGRAHALICFVLCMAVGLHACTLTGNWQGVELCALVWVYVARAHGPPTFVWLCVVYTRFGECAEF